MLNLIKSDYNINYSRP